MQLLLGLHCRAAAIVALLTWFSLYVGWGSYMNIGLVDNYHRYIPSSEKEMALVHNFLRWSLVIYFSNQLLFA